MEINNLDWKEYIEKERLEECLKNILSNQGYFITLFNNEGEIYSSKDSDKWNHLMCKNCEKNRGNCSEHYLLGQKVIGMKNGKAEFCEKDKERIIFIVSLETSSGIRIGSIAACKKINPADFNE